MMFTLFALQPAHAQDLLGHWAFETGSELVDSTGFWDDLVLGGDASVSDGDLDVNGSGTTATGWATSPAYSGPDIASKTLVSWVEMDDLGVTSGSTLSIDRRNDADVFDGIIWSEGFASRWQSGSNNGIHNQQGQNSSGVGTLQQVAIAYEDVGGGQIQLTICDGATQAHQSINNTVSTWNSSNAEMHMGLRHTLLGNRGALDAHLIENRIYGVALSCEEVALLQPAEDCVGNDIGACQIAADASSAINDLVGSPLMTEAASARLRPSTLDGHVTVLKQALADNGCNTGGYDRLTYGAYDGGVLAGAIGAATIEVDGTYGSSVISAAAGGEAIGDTYSRYRKNNFVADLDGDTDRVLAGRFIRTAGRRGVWAGIEATCAVHPGDALDDWFGVDIPNW